jgi:hypothetical protein
MSGASAVIVPRCLSPLILNDLVAQYVPVGMIVQPGLAGSAARVWSGFPVIFRCVESTMMSSPLYWHLPAPAPTGA